MPERAPLLLASSSPRRLALLRQVGVIPDRIAAPEVDETALPRELPRAHVLRLAAAKASDVARRPEAAGAFVLAADTAVACGRRILGKADDEAAALRCLRLLSGRRHRVYTAVAVVAPDGRRAVRVAQTVVRFKRLHQRDIASYLASRRMARQGRRLCHPGPRRSVHSRDQRQLFQRRRPAARDHARPAAGPRLAERAMSRELMIERSPFGLSAALLEDGRLLEVGQLDEPAADPQGDIVLGRVRKIERDLDAAFVDCGYGADACSAPAMPATSPAPGAMSRSSAS